jgi:serine/threonine-protein kinase
MRSHLNDKPASPTLLNPRLPEQLSGVLLKALEKMPDDRFASAQEFLAALEAVPATGIREIFSVETRSLQIPSGEGRLGSARESGSQVAQQKSGNNSAAQFPLDDISKKLAVYIGPIASVVVRKLAPKCANLDQLYREAATHISSDKDKQAFLQSRRH